MIDGDEQLCPPPGPAAHRRRPDPRRPWPGGRWSSTAWTFPTFGMVKDDRHRTRALVTPDGREIGIQGAPALFAFLGQIQERPTAPPWGTITNDTRKRASARPGKIPGIGPARRKQLFKSFGSVEQAIRAASLPALMEVVAQRRGRAVWQHFHAALEKTNEED
ncbi:MAG: hypothetical protein ACLUNZ_10990 [Evtepia sp.]